MILHQSRLKSKKRISDEFFHSTMEGIAWISARFNSRIDQVNWEGISPFPSTSVYLSVKAQDKLWRETGDVKCKEASECMVAMLDFFGRRWGNAREFSPTNEADVLIEDREIPTNDRGGNVDSEG